MNSIDKAFRDIRRADFVPRVLRDLAGINEPLPIGYGQTNSQPFTVKIMLEWLGAKAGDKVLDVGSGSGWTTALLAHIVGPKGGVLAVEIIPELVELGRSNCEKAGVRNVEFFQSGNVLGLPKFAPYDRILVSAAAKEFPEALLDQLVAGGKLVIPVKTDIFEVAKSLNADYIITKHAGFEFVPLI
jgi:protein-L-isoaspartate(D-aspartate) O-methyltransferase